MSGGTGTGWALESKKTKNLENLASLGEAQLKGVLQSYIKTLNETLEVLNNSEKDNSGALDPILSDYKYLYESQTERFREEYGVEFSELQNQYNKILPEINKYLKIKSD